MKVLRFSLVIAAAFLFTDSRAQMKLALSNPRWNDVQPYPVTGRNQNDFSKKPLKFAEFQTVEFHRSWTKSSAKLSNPGSGWVWKQPLYSYNTRYMTEHSHSSARFILQDTTNRRAQVYTFNNFDGKRLVVGQDPNSNLNWLIDALGIHSSSKKTYYIQVFVDNEEKPWELLLNHDAAEMNAEKYEGYFALDKEHFYYIRPSNKIKGKKGPINVPFGMIGFEIFDRDNKPIAAVSRINKGEVYFNTTDANERFLIGNLCAALLLYNEDA